MIYSPNESLSANSSSYCFYNLNSESSSDDKSESLPNEEISDVLEGESSASEQDMSQSPMNTLNLRAVVWNWISSKKGLSRHRGDDVGEDVGTEEDMGREKGRDFSIHHHLHLCNFLIQCRIFPRWTSNSRNHPSFSHFALQDHICPPILKFQHHVYSTSTLMTPYWNDL